VFERGNKEAQERTWLFQEQKERKHQTGQENNYKEGKLKENRSNTRNRTLEIRRGSRGGDEKELVHLEDKNGKKRSTNAVLNILGVSRS